MTTLRNLASSYRSAGRTADAIAIEEQVVADRERLLGPEHPDTVGARGNLEIMKRDPRVGRRHSRRWWRKRPRTIVRDAASPVYRKLPYT